MNNAGHIVCYKDKLIRLQKKSKIRKLISNFGFNRGAIAQKSLITQYSD